MTMDDLQLSFLLSCGQVSFKHTLPCTKRVSEPCLLVSVCVAARQQACPLRCLPNCRQARPAATRRSAAAAAAPAPQ